MEQRSAAHERLVTDGENRYLNLIYRFLHNQIDVTKFRHTLHGHWAQERDALWRAACLPTHRDHRPLTRLLDRLDGIRTSRCDTDSLRSEVLALLDAYRAAKTGDDASPLAAPPRLSLFERSLPEGWVYPCTLDDIRQQLSCVSEQDLEGLWAVGLAPPELDTKDCYGTYYPYGYRRRARGPVIVLWAQPPRLAFKMRRSYPRGQIERRFRVETAYGMAVGERGGHTECRWEPECLRRYMAEHVLLHEVGHHVQYRQRQRAGLSPFPDHRPCEQFADDYALRAVRRKRA